jgi:saccharopine dehydrogenase-like NADP-dependent oxidoreductase
VIQSVRVIGVRKVGDVLAILLKVRGFEVRAYDALARTDLPFPAAALDVRDQVGLRAALIGGDAVVSCLPYTLNLGVAEAAHEIGVHYFDLTEDVSTTSRVKELADKGGGLVFAPQCGLAPGQIGRMQSAMIGKA